MLFIIIILAGLAYFVFAKMNKERKRFEANAEQTMQDNEKFTAFLNAPDDEKRAANFAKQNNDMRATYSIKGISSGFVIVILVGFGVYWFYNGMISPYFKADEARLEMLSKDRDRLLEYEPMGKIVDSRGRCFNIYHKDDAYYIYNIGDDNKRNYNDEYTNERNYSSECKDNDNSDIERQQSLSYYALSLFEYGGTASDSEFITHSELLDKYIRLTPCTYYDDRGNYYNYCFFNGEDRVYFNI